MSKAFTRESDETPEPRTPVRPLSVLPPGTKNYLTSDGAARLRDELERLLKIERPALAGTTSDPDIKRRLIALDYRLAQLEECLRTATVVPPPEPPWDHVRFGARVTLRDRAGHEDAFRIVGAEEADPAQDQISWLSPIAKALLNARLGQWVRLQIPAGQREVEVLSIHYP